MSEIPIIEGSDNTEDPDIFNYMDNFFPSENYKIPVMSNYLNKFPQGETSFRILTPAIVGYEYFRADNKPVRSREQFDGIPSDIKEGSQVRHFWAFVIWNYEAKRIQILEITQKTIMTPLKALIDNPKWGNPVGKYDITITRKGSTMNDTEYAVMPNPATDTLAEITEAFDKAAIVLDVLFEGKDPFAKSE